MEVVLHPCVGDRFPRNVDDVYDSRAIGWVSLV